MSVKVSIVIPSYNRYPQNRLTLYSLEKQTVSNLQYEVILVDGGSTDGTFDYMKTYEPPFAFQYVRFQHNLNRSATRNQGVSRASGEVIIFLDAEVIVRPDFIERHLRHHQRQDHLVISGAMRGYQLYSALDSKMTEDQMHQLYEQIKHKPKYLKRCRLSLIQDASQLRTLRTFRENNQPPLRLLSRKDVHLSRFRRLATPHCWVHMLFEQFGDHLQGFIFPWMLFVTRNVSVKRAMLDRTGWFDENYHGFGHEDFDLGYRLYQHGAKFWNDPQIPYYHQEHFTPREERGDSFLQNVLYFIEKYQGFELKLFVIMGLLQMNTLTIHHTWTELRRLQVEHEAKYRTVINFLEQLFSHIIDLVKSQKPLRAIAIQVGIHKTHPLRIQITQCVIENATFSNYKYTTSLLQTLIYR